MKRQPAWIPAVAAILLAAGSNGWALYEPYKFRDPSRRWELSLALNASYDDNINTVDRNEVGSLTMSTEPEFLLNVPFEQSFLGMRYKYGATYYEERGGDQIDQSHTLDLLFSHTFSPRLTLDAQNQFRRGIEPGLVELVAGVPLVTERRGDYFYDNLSGTLSYSLARRCSVSLDGRWEFWRFDDQQIAEANDRDGYRIGVSSLYAVSPRVQLGGGYRFTKTEYRLDSRIVLSPFITQIVPAEARSSDTHEAFVAAVSRFNPQLSGRLTVGGQLQEFGDGTESTSPSVDGALTYHYGPQNTVTAGYRYSFATTELNQFRTTESSLVYVDIAHQLTAKLRATLSGSYYLNSFKEPTVTLVPPIPESEDSIGLSAGLSYSITSWCRANCRYSFSRVNSDISNRTFQRNVVSIGLQLIY